MNGMSGWGSDLFVQLWDSNQEELSKPCWTFYGPRVRPVDISFPKESSRSSVKCLHASLLGFRTISLFVRICLGKHYLLILTLNASGDTRDDIYQYDISHLNSPIGQAREGSNSPSWSNTQHEVRVSSARIFTEP